MNLQFGIRLGGIVKMLQDPSNPAHNRMLFVFIIREYFYLKVAEGNVVRRAG